MIASRRYLRWKCKHRKWGTLEDFSSFLSLPTVLCDERPLALCLWVVMLRCVMVIKQLDYLETRFNPPRTLHWPLALVAVHSGSWSERFWKKENREFKTMITGMTFFWQFLKILKTLLLVHIGQNDDSQARSEHRFLISFYHLKKIGACVFPVPQNHPQMSRS